MTESELLKLTVDYLEKQANYINNLQATIGTLITVLETIADSELLPKEAQTSVETIILELKFAGIGTDRGKASDPRS